MTRNHGSHFLEDEITCSETVLLRSVKQTENCDNSFKIIDEYCQFRILDLKKTDRIEEWNFLNVYIINYCIVFRWMNRILLIISH